MKNKFALLLFILLPAIAAPVCAGSLTIAAAADLKYAMAEVVEKFRASRSGDKIEVIYGSSGKFFTQIANGAPFDMYFSADIAYPRKLEQQGLTAGRRSPMPWGASCCGASIPNWRKRH